MIIGISGKIGSGKDTVGKIIQYLQAKHYAQYYNPNNEYDFKSYIRNEHDKTSNWQICKFADPLKDIMCILTGCAREQLEDSEFKNSKLPPEWDKYIFGIDKYVSRDTIIEEYKKLWNVYPSNYWIESQRISITYRQLLQNIGTDLFRDQLHPNTWINALFSKYKAIDNRSMQDPDDSNIKYPNWVITDVRFPNEAKAIKDRGGILIRVNRVVGYNKFFGTGGEMTEHFSEIALDDYEFDYVIDNNKGIDDLIPLVKNILLNLKII